VGKQLRDECFEKRKKFCDNLLRKGFESNLVYEKVKELESMERE
jgi:regulatory protein